MVLQESHHDCKPKVLLFNKMQSIRIPGVCVQVVSIPEYNENPCWFNKLKIDNRTWRLPETYCISVQALRGPGLSVEPKIQERKSRTIQWTGDVFRIRWIEVHHESIYQANLDSKRWAYLWWVFRTQGKADSMDTAMAIFVTTPIARTASWVFLWFMKFITTRKISHMNPDVAHPEWIPPRCCNIDVQASRNDKGVHWKPHLSLSIGTVNNDVRTNLGKEGIYE